MHDQHERKGVTRGAAAAPARKAKSEARAANPPPERKEPPSKAAEMPLEHWYFLGEGSVMRPD